MRTLPKLLIPILCLDLILFIFILPPSMWMLFNAQTWIGLGLGICGLLLFSLPYLLFGWYLQRDKRKIWGGGSAIITMLVSGFLVVVMLAAPSGSSGPQSPVQHRFFREEYFHRFSLSNTIPEIEQMNLGFLLMPYLDPILTAEQAERVSVFTLDLYREMESNRDFHELGSVMDLAYADLFGLPANAGHYYLYVPQNKAEGPLPAIVFLHGSGGNFKPYIWVWSKLAEAKGFVIIAPSYGFGSWDQDGVDVVLEAIEDAKQVVNIDEDQLYLAGLSNGGLGVSQLADEVPEMFRGLIFLSPVMANHIVDSPAFQGKWQNRPVLVISGAVDRRIPIGYIEQRVSTMEAGEIDVSTVIYPDEDHFLLFSQPQNIMDDVANWLEEFDK